MSGWHRRQAADWRCPERTITDSHTAHYARCITRVLKYIEAHLDGDLSIKALSTVANFSPHHFHRQFCAYTGIGVGRLVQLYRLRRASMQLVFNSRASITHIAYDAGFANAESFSRAFKNETGNSPTDFRKLPEWAPWQFRSMLIHVEHTAGAQNHAGRDR